MRHRPSAAAQRQVGDHDAEIPVALEQHGARGFEDLGRGNRRLDQPVDHKVGLPLDRRVRAAEILGELGCGLGRDVVGQAWRHDDAEGDRGPRLGFTLARESGGRCHAGDAACAAASSLIALSG